MTNEQRDEKIGEIHTAVMVMSKSVRNHDKVLFGNGRPGHVDRLKELEVNQKNCKGRQAGNKQNLFLGVAIISAGIALFSFILNIFRPV